MTELAAHRSVAAIPFGGRYRLIDFPLSNMVNSGINKIYLITSSKYRSLMEHVGSGKDWDLSRKREASWSFLLIPREKPTAFIKEGWMP